MTNYLIRVLSALSQLVNASFLNGHPNESVSGRSYREGWAIERWIDTFFLYVFSQPNHCMDAHLNEKVWAREILKSKR